MWTGPDGAEGCSGTYCPVPFQHGLMVWEPGSGVRILTRKRCRTPGWPTRHRQALPRSPGARPRVVVLPGNPGMHRLTTRAVAAAPVPPDCRRPRGQGHRRASGAVAGASRTGPPTPPSVAARRRAQNLLRPHDEDSVGDVRTDHIHTWGDLRLEYKFVGHSGGLKVGLSWGRRSACSRAALSALGSLSRHLAQASWRRRGRHMRTLRQALSPGPSLFRMVRPQSGGTPSLSMPVASVVPGLARAAPDPSIVRPARTPSPVCQLASIGCSSLPVATGTWRPSSPSR